jgi:beta-glucosidase
MPGKHYIEAYGLRLLEEGKVNQAQIDRMAKSIIRTCIAMGLYDRPVKDESFLKRFPEHEKVALQTAREGIVLLRNRDSLLPLRRGSAKRILLTGSYVETLAHGGGAADVEGYDNVTMLQAFKNVYGDRVEYVKSPTDAQIEAAEAVLLSTGTNDSECMDRPFALPDEEERFVKRVVSLNPRTVVIVNSGGGVKMTGWNDQAGAILYAWYPGQLGNRALAEIVCGDVNPSGKLPITIEKHFEDSPGFGYIPEGCELYTGIAPDDDMSQPIIRVEYKEGVFVGYRWYLSKKIEPLYAFGHGLSYTKFSYGNLRIAPDTLPPGGCVSIEFTVTNSGNVAGSEVAQLYIHDAVSSVPRPLKELKGFSKLALQPRESRVVQIRLVPSDLAFWDVMTHDWNAEPGEYRVLVGGSSDRTVLEGSFTLK